MPSDQKIHINIFISLPRMFFVFLFIIIKVWCRRLEKTTVLFNSPETARMLVHQQATLDCPWAGHLVLGDGAWLVCILYVGELIVVGFFLVPFIHYTSNFSCIIHLPTESRACFNHTECRLTVLCNHYFPVKKHKSYPVFVQRCKC